VKLILHQQGADVGEFLEEGGGTGEGREGRGGGQVEGGDSGPVSIKNKEPSPASQEVQSLRGFSYFLLLKGGREGVGSILQSSTEFQS
jgi:hypothetical protein